MTYYAHHRMNQSDQSVRDWMTRNLLNAEPDLARRRETARRVARYRLVRREGFTVGYLLREVGAMVYRQTFHATERHALNGGPA